MDGHRESDSSIVPRKRANKVESRGFAAEFVEGRGLAEGNKIERTRDRTQCRAFLQHDLDRVRQAGKRDKKLKFTVLWHHVYNIYRLREAYLNLKRKASPGVDGKTWSDYGKELASNLQSLSERLKRGSYRAKPVARVYIPKPDGGQRPIGKTSLEDKIVERSTVEVLNAVYEELFKGFSYGFRPHCSAHKALDALSIAIERKKVNWILDCDIRGFFDAIDHEWLIRFIEHRIGDKRVIRHIKKWLKAGVLEDGMVHEVEEGTPQGGSISPQLANIYLHYAFDLWIAWWRRTEARGDVIVVRYADDIIVGFQYYGEAKRFVTLLRERLLKFNLELNPSKTRLIEFGRFAIDDRQRRGLGKPETFNFLGFTHICHKTRNGKFVVRRQTMAQRFRRKLKEIKELLRKRMHAAIWQVGVWLRSVLTGYYRYYAVPLNYAKIRSFREEIIRLWFKILRRRSQRYRLSWKRMCQIASEWLPYPRILHPYPSQRLIV
jgi:RNA-directed DNA polymerase